MYTHTNTRTHIHNIHTYTHAYPHTHTHNTGTHIQTHTHTYNTHTQTCVYDDKHLYPVRAFANLISSALTISSKTLSSQTSSRIRFGPLFRALCKGEDLMGATKAVGKMSWRTQPHSRVQTQDQEDCMKEESQGSLAPTPTPTA